MNLLDVLFVAFVVFGLVAGVRSGALPQIGGLLGAVAGGAVAIWAAPYVRDRLDTADPTLRAFLVLAGLILLVGLGETLGSTTGQFLSLRLGRGVLGRIDQAGGGLVGAAQAILVVWLAGGLLAVGPFPDLAEQAQRSTSVRVLNQVLPPAADVANDVGHLIDVSGLPEVFVGLEKFPAPPVAVPGSSEANAIAAAAVASTVEVESSACGFGLAGTGFAIAPGYVVTNAHVVAGASHTTVVGQSSRSDATVVLFDPELDVALLRAPDFHGPPLRLATSSPARGSIAAALGHPGGGALAIVPAAVADTYRAEGFDLYGDQRVVRSIVELRARIERGDSGGPLVLQDGTVGGVVFAEARSDPTVGYALAPGDVAARVQPAVGRTSAVSTGPCVR